ncbi:MAG: SusD/RagB family nutrient-binding outer membrane lipoprotein [Flavobacterium sp.]|nr:SusD/RagB family nutrient-binding outer membrane lipoprotein [Flavobacterium sp.]
MKKIKFILLASLVLGFLSCDNYLDVNTDPSNLPGEKLSPSKILPGALSGAAAVQVTTMNELGNVFTNAWAGNVSAYTGVYTREFQLTIDNAFGNGIWNNLYLNINNFQAIIDYKDNTGKYDNYKAVAKICKAHYMQYIVDLYGDAPYTEAFKGVDNRTPKYNDDQFIYRDLFKLLDEARFALDPANTNPNADDIAPYDIMFHGNYLTWTEFANTVELRMLLRMSNCNGTLAAYRDTRLAALSSSSTPGFISSDVFVNPGYSAANDAQTNPFYATFGWDSAGNPTGNRTAICPSGHVYKSLNTNATWNSGAAPDIISGSGIKYANVADGRRSRLFASGANQSVIRAVTQGSPNVDVYPVGNTPSAPGRIGSGLFNSNLQNPAPATVKDYAPNNIYVMLSSESEFLQAEAALRYPSLFVGVSSHFNTGISNSFTHLNSTIGTYLLTIATKPNFGYNVANTFAQNLHAIMYQKWVALIGTHGIESFIEYNRTGYPLTPLATNATQLIKPRRLIYPISEYVANSANVPNITPDQIFAATDPSHPFWMLGDPALGN